MLRPARPVLALLLLGLALGACSKCDAAGWFKSCGDAAPKAFAAVQ
ncbi:MAG: hypothetical protein IT562_22500 [Alphaproteobacteria bacterium]|nr:hypothetical protein [Alphaproteobacteria bacterium]